MNFTGEKNKTNKNTNEFSKKISRSSRENKSLIKSFTPFISYGSLTLAKEKFPYIASAKTMQIICQMKKIYTESYDMSSSTQLKKHLIKIQSIYICVRMSNAVQCVEESTANMYVCMHITIVLHRCYFATTVCIRHLLHVCRGSQAIEICKFTLANSAFSLTFFLVHLWNSFTRYIKQLFTLQRITLVFCSSSSTYHAWRNDDLMW